MDTQIAERFGLGAPDQISFAVADLDEAVPRYERLFGHFDTADVTLDDVLCGDGQQTVELRLGFAHPGAIEIELVEVVRGDGHPMTSFLADKGEGVHHVRFPVPSVDATRAAMEAAGFTTTFAGGDAATVQFAYLQAAEILGGTSIELITRME